MVNQGPAMRISYNLRLVVLSNRRKHSITVALDNQTVKVENDETVREGERKQRGRMGNNNLNILN